MIANNVKPGRYELARARMVLVTKLRSPRSHAIPPPRYQVPPAA